MAVTLVLLDGTSTTVEPVPGKTCKEALIDLGVMTGPPEVWQVVTPDNRVVDNEQITAFDQKKLQITATKGKGGC